ncbi:hypothetical protein C8J57DRAFT_1237665 [Mycena rebaudengoi]|nr:hypothetical protein C8J57DRAFT_1237665 [Mycena rebaudengoi]
MNGVHEARENGRINIPVNALDTRLSWPQITIEEVRCRSTSRYNEQEQKIWIFRVFWVPKVGKVRNQIEVSTSLSLRLLSEPSESVFNSQKLLPSSVSSSSLLDVAVATGWLLSLFFFSSTSSAPRRSPSGPAKRAAENVPRDSHSDARENSSSTHRARVTAGKEMLSSIWPNIEMDAVQLVKSQLSSKHADFYEILPRMGVTQLVWNLWRDRGGARGRSIWAVVEELAAQDSWRIFSNDIKLTPVVSGMGKAGRERNRRKQTPADQIWIKSLSIRLAIANGTSYLPIIVVNLLTSDCGEILGSTSLSILNATKADITQMTETAAFSPGGAVTFSLDASNRLFRSEGKIPWRHRTGR